MSESIEHIQSGIDELTHFIKMYDAMKKHKKETNKSGLITVSIDGWILPEREVFTKKLEELKRN